MTTAVITPTREEWVVLDKFFDQLRMLGSTRAVVVHPDIDTKLTALGGEAPDTLPTTSLSLIDDCADFCLEVVEPETVTFEFMDEIELPRNELMARLEDSELDDDLEKIALAYGLTPSWHRE